MPCLFAILRISSRSLSIGEIKEQMESLPSSAYWQNQPNRLEDVPAMISL